MCASTPLLLLVPLLILNKTAISLLPCTTFATALANQGNGAGTALLAFMFLFSGFFISYSSIPKGWRWFTALSMFKYPFEGMIRNMLDEEEDRSGSSGVRTNDLSNVPFFGVLR